MSARDADEATEFLKGRREVSALPQMELRTYRALAGHVPPPTDEHIRQFASHVAKAKSWYKHLPLVPPGERFCFFVDPRAGLDRILLPNGHVVFLHRTNDTPRFHYSWMTTEDYRSQFSRLSFACDAATELFLAVSCQLQEGREIDGHFANNPSRASVHMSEEREFRLPQEVLDAGTIRLTGVIHPLVARPWIWLKRVGNVQQPLPWPAESGGAEMSGKIMARCREWLRIWQSTPPEERVNSDVVDEELSDLLAPERRRLQDSMISAMQRVVAVTYGTSA